MRVGEQLAYLRCFYEGWDEAKERELLGVMKLDAEARVGDLSQGQRARLKIVAAFAWPSLVVIMDEPLNGIDPPTRRRILQTLMQEFRMEEQTVLISTHLVDEVEELVENVVYLRDGEVALAGAADQMRSERGGSLSDIFEEVVT
jgi:ABC-2 type transport system ATP-binding protein